MMTKDRAVASLGQGSLLKPVQVREALKANDRLKLYLTLLQAAAQHAASPQRPAADLAREVAAADIAREDARWLRDLPGGATLEAQTLHLPGLSRLAERLRHDLRTMARPALDDVDADPELSQRAGHWDEWLGSSCTGDALGLPQLAQLTHARRQEGDSLHLLVMDLHKAVNRVAAGVSGENVAGAHCWQLAEDGSDRPRIAAFMRGLSRTRALKLDHPGLDTAATRDGDRLLIQNDIGTNDAHVLVLQVQGLAITLTYSELHRQRFAFFQRQLEQVGAQWSGVELKTTPGLNAGAGYQVGTARFEAKDLDELDRRLEDIGRRIVFLIDWNRARKRLLAFVDKEGAVAVLQETTRRECGHMAWLAMGGERLVWSAMASQGGAFRLGERLDDVMGEDTAVALLADVLELAHHAVERHQPAALVADETRLLFARRLAGRRDGLDLLAEHAALCHALAQAVRDGLAHGVERDLPAAEALSARAKAWERQADELVMRARTRAERQPRWQPLAALMQRADDVADPLEEAAFVLSLIADDHHQGWGHGVRAALRELAEAVLTAVQDHVKAVAIARSLGEDSDAADQDEVIDVLWRVVQAERQCDELLRSARRALVREVRDPASLQLGNELANALELSSDALLAIGYALRERALQRVVGAPS